MSEDSRKPAEFIGGPLCGLEGITMDTAKFGPVQQNFYINAVSLQTAGRGPKLTTQFWTLGQGAPNAIATYGLDMVNRRLEYLGMKK